MRRTTMTVTTLSSTVKRFRDRREAGRLLGDLVAPEVQGEDVVVLALPRGGVEVGYEVSSRLQAPLDVLLVRKLGLPWQPELAFGALASGDVVVMNEDHVRALGLGQRLIRDVVQRERLELEHREQLYRPERKPIRLRGKTVVVVDDGIATGATVRAALESLAKRGAARRIVACPVAPAETVHALEREAELVLCLQTPLNFTAVGAWYDDFLPVSDDEVRRLLAKARTVPQSAA
jgi:predicted phosphoribosyltransferase